MSTSKPPVPPVPPAPQGTGGTGVPNSYTRFIPREELGSFAAWSPQSFEQPPQGQGPDGGARKPTFAERAAASSPVRPQPLKPGAPGAASHAFAARAAATGPAVPVAPAPSAVSGGRAVPRPGMPSGPAAGAPSAVGAKGATVTKLRRPVIGGVPGEEPMIEPEAQELADAPPAPNVAELVEAARKDGYQDGYRNGLAALESYKQTQAAQLAAYMNDQIGALASDFHRRLESLEQQLAGRVAGVALELARQVVRSELDQRPEVVLSVAEEALGVLLASARQVQLRLNPEDHAMALGSLTEVLQARGARLMPDHAVTRGGCIVESDIATVDASVEARWLRAAAAMGSQSEWNQGHELPYKPLTPDQLEDVDADLHPMPPVDAAGDPS